MNIELWKKRKKELNLNYDQLADLTGYPKSTITNIFLGYVKSPRIDTVEAIERALGISSEGLTPEERAAGASETRRTAITPIEDELLYLFRQLGAKRGEAAQRSILTVIENML